MLFFLWHPGTLREILAVHDTLFSLCNFMGMYFETKSFFNILFLVRCSPYKVVYRLLPILFNDLSSFAVIIYFDVQKVSDLARGGSFHLASGAFDFS